MELEYIKESIKNCIEIRKNFWTALLGLVGSLLIIFAAPAIMIPFKAVLFFIVILFIFIVMVAIYLSNKEIQEFLQEIRRLK